MRTLISRLSPLASRLAAALTCTFIMLGISDAHAQDRLLPQSRRITDEAIARDRKLIASWQERARAVEAAPATRCSGTRSSELLAFVAREYDLNNRDREVDSAFAEAVDRVTALERGQGVTPCPAVATDTPAAAPAAPSAAPAMPGAAPVPVVHTSPDAVHFAFDRASLGHASIVAIDLVAGILRAEPALRVRLDAYTDPVGTPAWNLRLAARRGAAVRERLVEQGVAPARITVVPHGEGASRGEGESRRERHANDRRVEVTLEGEGSERVRVVRQRDDVQPTPPRPR